MTASELLDATPQKRVAVPGSRGRESLLSVSPLSRIMSRPARRPACSTALPRALLVSHSIVNAFTTIATGDKIHPPPGELLLCRPWTARLPSVNLGGRHAKCGLLFLKSTLAFF